MKKKYTITHQLGYCMRLSITAATGTKVLEEFCLLRTAAIGKHVLEKVALSITASIGMKMDVLEKKVEEQKSGSIDFADQN